MLRNFSAAVIAAFTALLLFSCGKELALVDKEIRGSITGTVTDKSTGKPIAGVNVTTQPEGYSGTTNDKGEYTIPDVVPGNYAVHFTESFYVDTTSGMVSVGKTEEALVLNVAMKLKTGKIAGAVMDSLNPLSPKPIAEAKVVTEPLGYTTYTKADGTFDLADLAFGTYKLLITKTKYSEMTTDTLNVNVQQNVKNVTVYMTEKRGQITGTVSDSAGNGLPGISITTSSGGYSTTSVAGGVFTIPDVKTGTYTLSASQAGWFSASSGTVTVDENTYMGTAKITMQKMIGSISGKATDSAGTPLPGISVTASPGGVSTVTLADGTYQLPIIQTGTYVLTFSAAGYASYISPAAVISETAHAVSVSAVLSKSVASSGGSAEGLVTDAEGIPLVGITVTAYPSGYTTTTTAGGKYQLLIPVSGAYTLTFSSAGFEPMISSPFYVSPVSGAAQVNSVLTRTASALNGTISGKVTDESGTGLLGIAVTANPGGVSTTTAADGSYTLQIASAGSYTLTFSGTGYYPSSSSPVAISAKNPTAAVDGKIVKVSTSGKTREISGTLTGTVSSVDSVRAVISGEGISNLRYTLSWQPELNRYSGYFDLPASGTKWNLTVLVYSKGKISGKKSVTIDPAVGSVVFPAFSAMNSVPVFTAPLTSSITPSNGMYLFTVNTPASFSCQAADSAGDTLAYQWKFGENGVWTQPASSSSFSGIISDRGMSGICSLKVADSDGNSIVSTFAAASEHTVLFNEGTTAASPAQKVPFGGKVVQPAIDLGGYSAVWYSDAALTNPWNFNENKISGDTALYLKKSIITYSITYDLDGGTISSSNVSSYTSVSGDIVLAKPSKTGFVFKGWSTGDSIISVIKSGTSGNLALKAVWEKMILVRYRYFDVGRVFDSVFIAPGQRVKAPSITGRVWSGAFTGWYTASSKLWNFSSDVVGDKNFDLIGGWTAVPSDITAKGKFTDTDGNEYLTVKIGNQEWTIENLRTKTFADGSLIPQITAESEWAAATGPALKVYTASQDTIQKYGYFYNAYVVQSAKGLVPAAEAANGWRIPTQEDIEVFKKAMTAGNYSWNGVSPSTEFAHALAATSDWQANTDMSQAAGPGREPAYNNSTGFNLRPAGAIDEYGKYLVKGIYGHLHVKPSNGGALHFGIAYIGQTLMEYEPRTEAREMRNGYPIRMVRDVK